MTDGGMNSNSKRTEKSSHSSSLKRPKHSSRREAIPISVPNNKSIPQPVQSTVASASRRAKYVAGNRSSSGNTISDALDRAALMGTALHSHRSSSNRPRSIPIDDESTSVSTSSHQLHTDNVLGDIRAKKRNHKTFPKTVKTPTDMAGKAPSSSKSGGVISIDSDDEGTSRPPTTTTRPHQSTTAIHLEHIQSLKKNSISSLAASLRGENASTSSGGHTKINPNVTKKHPFSTAGTSRKTGTFGPNSRKSDQGFTVRVPEHMRPKQSDFWRSPSTQSVSSDQPKSHVNARPPLSVMSSSSARKPAQAKNEIIDIEDDSSDDGDFQSAPNSPLIGNEPLDTKKTTTASSKNYNKDVHTSPPASTQNTSSYHGNDPFLLSSRVPGTLKKRNASLASNDGIDIDSQASVEIADEMVKNNEKKSKRDKSPKRSMPQNPVSRMYGYKAPFSKTKQENTPSSSRTGVHDFPSSSSIINTMQKFGRNLINKSLGTPIEKPERTRSPSPPPSLRRPRRSLSPIMPYTSAFSSIFASSSVSIFTDPDEEALVYPFNGKKAVILKNSDISRLDDDKFLNDSIMDAYPKILQDEHPRDQIYTFSSFFFTRLTQSEKGSTDESSTAIKYEQVKRWTDKINIFEKEFIIIPIEQKYHWFLAIITNPGYCVGRIPDDDDDDVMIAEGLDDVPKSVKKAYITLLDSLGTERDSCYQQICNYLKAEAINRLKIDPVDFKAPVHIKGRAPLQSNLTDCGVHCLYCIKGLYENPDRIRPVLISPQPSNDNVWAPNLVKLFRYKLRKIFSNKAKEYVAYKKEQERIRAEEKVDEEEEDVVTIEEAPKDDSQGKEEEAAKDDDEIIKDEDVDMK